MSWFGRHSTESSASPQSYDLGADISLTNPDTIAYVRDCIQRYQTKRMAEEPAERIGKALLAVQKEGYAALDTTTHTIERIAHQTRGANTQKQNDALEDIIRTLKREKKEGAP